MERSREKVSRLVLFGVWLRLQIVMLPLFLGRRTRQSQRDQAMTTLQDASETVKGGLKRATRQAAGATSVGAQQLADQLQEKPSLREKVRSALHLSGAKQSLPSTNIQQSAQTAAQQATAAAQDAGEQAAARARAAAARARELRDMLTGGQRPGQVAQQVSEEQVPMLREVAMQAASTALDLWAAARTRAAETIEAAESGASHATHALEAEAERAKEAVEHRGEAVRGVFGGGDKAHDVTSSVADKAAEAREKTQTATKQAATATVQTGRATGAFLFWTGAAAGLVFFALMDEERRNQVKNFASTLVNQTRQLLQDIQGYDEEF